jgi:hypothetical protein
MYNEDTELLFPLRVIPSLEGLRGNGWDQLLADVMKADDPIKQKAFVLLMVRMGGCLTCNSDSFRAMRGCTQCAQRTVKRIRDDDEELFRQFQSNYDEVQAFLLNRGISAENEKLSL